MNPLNLNYQDITFLLKLSKNVFFIIEHSRKDSIENLLIDS